MFKSSTDATSQPSNYLDFEKFVMVSTDMSGSSPKINLANGVLRLLQLIFAVTIIGIYASAWHTAYFAHHSNFGLAVVVGVLSTITAIAFAIVPFLFSYRYVAILFVWDWILFFIWAALFATMNAKFNVDKERSNYYKSVGATGFPMLRKAVWVDLAAMLLWLITAIMGPVMLLLARKRGSRAVV